MSHILERINSPADLTQLTIGEMEQLAVELRRLIVDTVAENGGHLASSLGAIEFTLALYKVFRPPQDKVVWDVGHQAYAHKILTGRRERFSTLRRKGGITGFPAGQSQFTTFSAWATRLPLYQRLWDWLPPGISLAVASM